MSENEVAVSSEIPASKVESPRQEEQRRMEKLAASRLFFVRLPKPAEFASTDGLEKEKDEFDAKTKKITVDLQPIMAERSRLASQLAETREVIRELKAQIEDKEITLNPYHAEKKAAAQDRAAERLSREEQWKADQKEREDERRALQNSKQKIKNDFSSTYGHLGVSTDEEIDVKIKKLEFQQQHESLSINEEKAVLKSIKQLQDSREAVREYAQWCALENAEREARKIQKKIRDDEKARTSKEKDGQPASAEGKPEPSTEDPQQQEMRQLKKEVDSLWEDLKAALKTKTAQQEEEAVVKKQIDTLIGERDSLRREREEVWDKIQAHRNKMRSANKPFSENRGFSSSVRDLVKKGQVEEARKQCQEQTSEFMKRYASDATTREEYNRLWDGAVDYKRPAATASESHTSTAASVIAEALETARRTVASKAGRAKEAAAEVTKSIDTAKLKPKEETAAAESEPAAPLPVSKPDIPGMESSGRSKPKPKKEKKVKPAVVELPKLDETEFVPPPSVLKSSGPSAAELKEQEIAHNKAAAAEAAQRKERRRQAQEKKKVQKAQRAELQSKTPRQEAVEEVSRPETPPAAEETPLTNGGLSDGEPASVSVEDKISKAKKKARAINASAASAAKAALNTPKARSGRKKGASLSATLRQYSKAAQATFEEYPLYVGVGGAVAVAMGVLGSVYAFW